MVISMFATSFLFIDCGYIIPQDKVFFCNEVTLIKSGAQKSTGFLKDELRFPQAVEVAVGVDRLDLIALAEREADLRLFAGMQFLTLIALLGLERYPFDVVLRQHGVLHGADLDMDDAVFHRPDRDVLLHGASVVPGTISLIGSPQQTTGTPASLTLAMMLPQCLQM